MIYRILAVIFGLLISGIVGASNLTGWNLTTSNIGLAGAGLTCAGLQLYTGPQKPAAGTTITQQRITWEEFDLSNGNITLDRVCIQPTTAGGRSSIVFGYNPDTGDNQLGPVTIIDSDIDGSQVPASQNTIFATCAVRGAFNLRRNKMFGMGSGICYFGSSAVATSIIENNYVFGLRSGMYGSPLQQSHNESGTVRGFDGTANASLRWIGNRLESLSGADSAALFIQSTSVIQNVYLAGNLFHTTSWDLYIENQAGGTYSNIQAVNNRFLVPPGGFGDVAVNNGAGFSLWSENYRYDALGTDGKGAAIGSPGGSTNVAPAVTLTAPVNGASVNVSTTQTITATATDADGTISQVVFKNGDTVLCTDSASPFNCSWTPVATGSALLTAEATDNLSGLQISAGNLISVVSGSGSAPAITSALTKACTVGSPCSYTIACSNSPTTFSATGLPSGLSFASPTISGTPTSPGTFNATVGCSNVTGADSQTLVYTIAAAPSNVAPTATFTAPADGTTATQGASVAFSGTCADSDGTITACELREGAATLCTSGTGTLSCALSNLSLGAHSLTIRATDNAGATGSSAARTVTINAAAVSCEPITLTIQ